MKNKITLLRKKTRKLTILLVCILFSHTIDTLNAQIITIDSVRTNGNCSTYSITSMPISADKIDFNISNLNPSDTVYTYDWANGNPNAEICAFRTIVDTDTSYMRGAEYRVYTSLPTTPNLSTQVLATGAITSFRKIISVRNSQWNTNYCDYICYYSVDTSVVCKNSTQLCSSCNGGARIEPPICQNDSAILKIGSLKTHVNSQTTFNYHGTVKVEWGDSTQSFIHTISNNGGSVNIPFTKHKYNAPGNYNYKLTFISDSINICYSGVFEGEVVVPNGDSISSNSYINNQYCLSDTLFGAIDVEYSTCGTLNTTGTATLSYIASWGDGQNSVGTLNWNGSVYSGFFNHHYLYPGVYNYKIKINGASCNDSILGIETIVSNCGNLSGTVYNDVNDDCNQGTGEVGINWIDVVAISGNNTFHAAWTDTSGHYAFGNLPVGNYLIQIYGVSSGYTVNCGNSLAHITNVSATGATIENFALHCLGFDLAVTGINLLDGFYPGTYDAIFPEVDMLNNACNESVAGQVKVVLSPCIQYAANLGYLSYGVWTPFPTPSAVIPSVTGDTVVWNVADINQFTSLGYLDAFLTTVSTCTNAQVGDTACITVMVLPSTGDANPNNNTFTRCFEIGVSYDPNYKEVSPKGEGVAGNIPQNTNDLTYTLHFQNTGTAVARNIYLLDTISASLDLSTIEIVASSHPMQPYLLPNRTMKFMFANIMLPDSTNDEPHSHGYVTYRIKPNTNLPIGTQIKNTGYIYFDYNAPIITNTTLNTIAAPVNVTAIKEFSSVSGIRVYPNPAKDLLIVNITKNNNSTVAVTDLLGKIVLEQPITGLQTELNVSNLQNGIYFVSVNGKTQKVVINK